MKISKLLLIILFTVLIGSGNYAQVKNIAHRGGAALAPENTLAAFSNAIDIGADYFELDVQISSDDSLMIMHDNTINRTTNGTGSVSSLTYTQLRSYDAGSKFNASFAGEKIPTLYESLMLAKNSANNIGVVIEIKTTAATVVQKVVKMVQDLDMRNRVIISSFTLSQITESKTIDASIPVQLFVSTTSNSTIDQVAAINGEWIGSGGSATTAFLDYAHSKGVKFNSWTINSASQMISLSQLGVDAITTDNPQTLKTVSDTTPPSDVVFSTTSISETKVTLNWEAATDNESAVTGYKIYRDTIPNPTTLIASVDNVTNYTDETYTETKTFYYRIKAINGAGLLSANYSNELTATTSTDLTKPTLLYVTSNGEDTKIVVEFSERVDQTTAETKTNYTVNKSITVESATLALDQKSVILTTSALTDGSYKLTVKNVKDKALTPNTITTTSAIFLHSAISSNTVAYYSIDKIEQDSVLVDASSNLNNGTLKNGPILSEGISGNALQFDGVDDYVEFPSSPSFDINGSAVTVSLWTKLEYLPADLPGAFGPLFDSNSDQYVLYEDKGNNELRFKVSTSSSAERPGIPGNNLIAGEWIHVVGVYDGTYAKIYLNGIVQDSHQITGTVKTGQVAWLGRSATSSPSYFQGSIDNVLVLNTALSQAEVMDLYNSVKIAPVDPRPSDVVLTSVQVDDQNIRLQWQPAVNYESAIVGYEIYRDTQTEPTTLHATASNVTEYTDNNTEESKTYYYRVKAKNSSALLSPNFSNELSASTGQDITKPEILYTTSRAENNKLVVEFNEKVDQTSAQTISNFTLNYSASVTGALLASDQRSVILTTSDLSEDTYTLTVRNVKDIASAPNTMVTDSVKFTHKNLPDSVIAFYSMDAVQSDSVLTDYTSNANNGFLRNGTMLSEGLLGNGFVFDGVNDYVQFPASPSFDIGGSQVSVSLWVKLGYLPAELPGSFGPLFDSDGDQYVLYEDKGNKELRFKVATTAGAERPGIPETDLITGQWINVVGVYDGTKAMVYLNGVLKDSHNLTGDVKTGQQAWLGRSANNSPAYFKGSIDNVMIFNKALTQDEIVELYNNIKTEAVKIVSVEDDNYETVPLQFALLQNYPNPFNPTTTIRYELAEESKTELVIYDILGREIQTIVNEVKAPGRYEVKFNGSRLSSGVYFYRIKAGSFIDTKKFVLIK